MVSDVKAALVTDFESITVANGYNTDIQKVYKVLKEVTDVDISQIPAITFGLASAKSSVNSEGAITLDLRYMVVAYTRVADDIDDEGLAEEQIGLLYEDLATKLIESDNNVEQVAGVENVILGDPIFDSDEHQAIMALPITISYILK